MMILVVLSLFVTVISSILMANLNGAVYQEKYLKAYYLSKSGADLCLAALLKQGTGGANDTLLYKEYSVAENPSISTTEILTDTISPDGENSVDITVKALTISGERWVEIKSVATLTDSSFSKTTVLQFLVSNPLVKKEA